MLYEYLRYYDGIAASHTSGTRMGTDWRDNDPEVEPIVEIYQGDRQNYEMPGAPRSNSGRDSILADVRCAGHFMGEEFTLDTAPFARVHIIKDGSYVYTTRPGTAEVTFSWQDTEAEEGKTSYYYVRGEQSDGEIVWVSPMWINTQ